MFAYRPPSGPVAILHRDAALLAVAKPPGLLTVPGKGLPDCLEARVRALDAAARTVHRLDMDTSGLVVFARSAAAQRHLGLQFERRVLRKAYLARVAGRVAAASGVVDLPLRTDWPNRPRQEVHPEGRPSLTRWAVLRRGAGWTDLLLRPETGRSHQLRVHMAALGHPILGDPFYGDGIGRLMLHAWRLTLRHPEGGAWLRLEAPASPVAPPNVTEVPGT